MGHYHAGFHCLLNNGDFFLRCFTLMELLPSKIPVISKLELVLDIYPNLFFILRYIQGLVF